MVFDIIVLVQFYNQDRMIFFGISLTILIIVQYAYSYISWLRWSPPGDITIFALLCCCFIVPFASTFLYWIYFSDRYTNCDTDSQLSQWKTKKISKVLQNIHNFYQSL